MLIFYQIVTKKELLKQMSLKRLLKYHNVLILHSKVSKVMLIR